MKRYPSISVGCLCVILVFTRTVTGAAEHTNFDYNRFGALSPTDRLDFVLGCLQWRERQLDNFSYVLVASISKLKSGKPEPPYSITDVQVSRDGRKSLIHTSLSWKGKKQDEVWTSWDQKLTRLRRVRNDGISLGLITPNETSDLQHIYYNDVLGYQVSSASLRGIHVDQSESQWIEEQVKKHEHHAEVFVDTSSEILSVTITIKLAANEQEQLWFDPEKNFMLTREEYTAKYTGDEGYRRSQVMASKEIDGLWVPTEVVQRRCYSKSRSEGTEYKYVVSKFERGKVAPVDLAVTWPPGTRVLDCTGPIETAYRVKSDGSKEPLRHRDSRTGLINDGTAKTTKSGGAVFASAQAPFPNHGRRIWTIALFLGTTILAVALGLMLARRYRRRGASDGHSGQE